MLFLDKYLKVLKPERDRQQVFSIRGLQCQPLLLSQYRLTLKNDISSHNVLTWQSPESIYMLCLPCSLRGVPNMLMETVTLVCCLSILQLRNLCLSFIFPCNSGYSVYPITGCLACVYLLFLLVSWEAEFSYRVTCAPWDGAECKILYLM